MVYCAIGPSLPPVFNTVSFHVFEIKYINSIAHLSSANRSSDIVTVLCHKLDIRDELTPVVLTYFSDVASLRTKYCCANV